MTLLYIEDNMSNMQVIQMVLARSRPHWQFLSARDGKTGLELARANSPNLVLLDLQLPGMKGDEVLAELQRDPATREIPVVVLSADATARSRQQLLSGGAAGFITKPFQIDQFFKTLDETVRQPDAKP